jgi:sarcosine oxidase subunit delta
MLLIPCPYCGARPELEFVYAGQAHIERPQNPAEVPAQAWADYLYRRDNIRGLHAERWRHTHGCGRFFNALRDTSTDQFRASYPAGQPRPSLPLASGATVPP